MKDFLKKLKLNEQNISMGLGIVVVILVAGLLVKYFKSVNQTGKTSSTSTQTQETTGTVPSVLPGEYVVAAGDSLWTIADKTYGSGYNWVDVYAANKQIVGSNPSVLLVGTKLTLPKVEIKEPLSYTVEKGDNLWNISVKICQNGYAWVKTANENKLANPNLLYVGQVLKVVCN